MSKIRYKRNKKYWTSPENGHLKRQAEDVTGEAIRNMDHSPSMISSSGSPSSSEREELLKTINEPLFAEFFCNKRKRESSDTQSSSSSSGAQDSSEDNSPREDSPRDHSSEDRGQKTDTYSSNTISTEVSINKESQEHKRYEFQTTCILDGLSEQTFSKGTSISSLSSHDSSTNNKNVQTPIAKSSNDDVQKNLTQNKGTCTLPNSNETIIPKNTKGLDLLDSASSIWHYYENDVNSPSTSLDGFKRDNSTISDCLTSNSSVRALEEIQQEPHSGDNSGDTKSTGYSSSTESSLSSNHQDCLHDTSASPTDSECKELKNCSCNNSAQVNKVSIPSFTERAAQHGVGGYADVRPDMYLNAPKGYTRYTPYHTYNWNSPATQSMYSNLQTDLPQHDSQAYNQLEFVRYQTTSTDTAWYGHNITEQEMVQFSHTNLPNESYKIADAISYYDTLQNSENKITFNDSTTKDHAAGMSHFPQAPLVDDTMNRYNVEQKTMPIGNYEQNTQQVILPLENQDTVQKNEQIISETSNMESLVWSDEIRNILENNTSSTMQYPNVRHQQQLLRFSNNTKVNSTPFRQSQDMFQNTSQQNFQASGKLINSPEEHITTNSQRKSSRKNPKSQMAFIALAIMSHPDCKMTLSEIYQHIEKNHPQYLRRPDWRNGVRHTLSHNVCFIKIEKAVHRPRKGHYWSIHPACIDAFSKGKFCLRHSKRLVMTSNNPCILSGEPQQESLF